MQSSLFRAYRSVGHVTSAVPFALNKLGTAYFLAVATDKAFQIYNCDKLRLVLSSPPRADAIQAIATDGELTFTACGPNILVWRRLDVVRELSAHSADVNHLLVFGPHLLSVGDDQVLNIWEIKTGELVGHLEFRQEDRVSAIIHPNTYLNKVLIGFESGRMELWNLRSQKLVFSFNNWGSPVTSLGQSSVVDVVGVGLADGRCVVHNLRFNETICTFTQADGAVTALSFRTDETPMLATSSPRGHIAVWNLEKKQLLTMVRDAHDANISSLQFLPGQPLLLSGGADNSIKMWIFDQDDGSARLLKYRSGHSAPPTKIRFYGDGDFVLSSGLDRSLRMFSIIRDEQSREISQGSLEKKAKKSQIAAEELRLPVAVDFAASPMKEKEWANVISCHSQDPVAHTWRTWTKAIGEHKLRNLNLTQSPIKSVALSGCGNFGVVGADDGNIYKYNMQSGLFRGKFGAKLLPNQPAHTGPVTGLAVDSLNRYLVSSSLDGTIKFWNFQKCELVMTIDVGVAISQMLFHSENDLVAVACDDLVLRVYDATTYKLVRNFRGHGHRITDMTFSPDGRWLVAASMDSCVRVYDLPSSRLIDWIKFAHAVTSVSFSPRNDFLATSHVNTNSISLWANLNHFSNVYYKVPSEAIDLDMPHAAVFAVDFNEDEKNAEVVLQQADEPDSEDEEEEEDKKMETEQKPDGFVQPLSEDLFTMSSLPKSRWQNLTLLDIIKERNKPKEAPKAPAAAPFFLPTKVGVSMEFDIPQAPTAESSGAPRTRIMSTGTTYHKSKFVKLLEQTVATHDPEPVNEYLRSLGPSAIDAEIRQLGMDVLHEEYELDLFLNYLCIALPHKTNFELIQAYLNLFIKVHSDLIVNHPSLLQRLGQLNALHKEAWRSIQDYFHSNMCLVNYFSNIYT